MYDFFAGNALYGAFSNWVKPQSNTAAILIYIGFFAVCIAFAYFAGSLNAAIFISKYVYHDDIRNHGSGNAGTTNMLRTFGWKAAISTLLLDACKSAVTILFAWFMMGSYWCPGAFSGAPAAYLAMLFCIFGHIYPIYFKMKGGKGILCAAVCIGMLSPPVLAVLVVIFVVTVAFTKYVSLGSLLGAATYPLFFNSLCKAFGIAADGLITLITLLVMALLIYAHRSNIKRLYRHEEHKLNLRRRDKDAADHNSASTTDEED